MTSPEAYNDRMRLRTTLLVLAIAANGAAFSAVGETGRDTAECRKVKADIRKIEARMRQPYTAAQGIRFDERLRKLKDKRYRVCR